MTKGVEYGEGVAAFGRGVPRVDNPYEALTPAWLLWLQGWTCMADKVAEDRRGVVR